MRCALAFQCKSLNECSIEVRANSKREDAAVAAQSCHSRRDRLCVSFSNCWLSIGHEQNETKPARRNAALQCYIECAGDVSRADRAQGFQVSRGFSDVLRSRAHEIFTKRSHVRREIDQPEPVGAAQCPEHLFSCVPRLADLHARHRARYVQHERDVPRRWARCNCRRRQCYQRKAVFISRRVGKHRDRRFRRSPNGNEDRDLACVAPHPYLAPVTSLGCGYRVSRRVGRSICRGRGIRERERAGW